MATATYDLLDSTTLASSASSVTFSSISQDYRDLVLVIDSLTSSAAQVSFRLNSDTGSNYSRVWAEGYSGGSIESQSTTEGLVRLADETYSNTSRGYLATINFMDYSATDKHKTMLSRTGRGTTPFEGTNMTASRWANTAAITTIQLLNAGGQNFLADSTFRLYGIAS